MLHQEAPAVDVARGQLAVVVAVCVPLHQLLHPQLGPHIGSIHAESAETFMPANTLDGL